MSNYEEKEITLRNGETVYVYKVNRDSNGNPRYVFHYLTLADTYPRACWIANQRGARKYKAKWYGGGIVMQSYNIVEELSDIVEFARGLDRIKKHRVSTG